jgi:hypothetical protein
MQPPLLHLGSSFPPPNLERPYSFGCCHYYIPHTYRTCTLKRVKAFKLIYLADPKRSVTTTLDGLSKVQQGKMPIDEQGNSRKPRSPEARRKDNAKQKERRKGNKELTDEFKAKRREYVVKRRQKEKEQKEKGKELE